MPPLYPPEYPYRPDAPLLSMGPSFAEEIACSVVRAIWHENPEQPHETDVRTAAGLTMLEAFHPRDQLETMLASQGVAAHCAVMDSFRDAGNPDMPPLLAIKFRASAVSLGRMFCNYVHELTNLQSRPLPPRPGQPPISPTRAGNGGEPPPAPETPAPESPAPESPATVRPRARAKTSRAKGATPTVASTQPVPDPIYAPAEPLVPLEDLPELPEDIVTRPDGTPGNLTAYVPKVPVVPYIPPREAPIMVALATRPKPWRMVNVPKDQAPIGCEDTTLPAAVVPEPERQPQRGPVDLRERIFTGDALARFAATRLDPDAPVEPLQFDPDACLVELELISTGGNPSAEADKAAMMAAHPEGKPIVTFRYGTSPPSGAPLPSEEDEPPPDR
jgi:hypothetical protein